MSRVGIWCAIGAATLALVTAVTWNAGDADVAPVAAASGAQLFRSKGCSSCHVGPDSVPMVSGFPRLVDAASWAGDRRPGLNAEDYLAESMVAPQAFISPAFAGGGPTSAMPQLALSASEVEALVDYLLER